ncbi:unnamed protein product [Sphagnum jensenii]|uniref:Phosphoglycerate kinase n=2 Tax=Sphagnum jensenii TaxID=128206 RepID=A0ABP0VC80_9BRYO
MAKKKSVGDLDEVVKADDSIGPEVEEKVVALPNGGVLFLENLRFYKEEEKNDPEHAKKLVANVDLYVNDAFGITHCAHASTKGVMAFFKPFVAGFLLQKVNIFLFGGGMIFTFYKAQGLKVGASLVEEDELDLATSFIEKAKAKGVSLLMPTNVVIIDKFAPDANNKAIANKLANLNGKSVTTIIGGGDSVATVEQVGVADKMSHISTGGGASLELLEGKKVLFGVVALDETVAPLAV